MVTWLIQPVKIEHDKFDTLFSLLERGQIPYQIVYPLNGKIVTADKNEFHFKNDEKYFVSGSYTLTRPAYQKRPDSVFSLDNYNYFQLMNIFGRDNFVNHDALMSSINSIDWTKHSEYFIRPTEDTKAFNGGIYNKDNFTYTGDVILAPLNHISREYRFFILDEKIVTASLYKVNGQLQESDIIDLQAINFVQEMIPKFKHSGYVIDVALIGDEFKIMELNCFNASGFYKINLYNLVMAVEEHYEKPQLGRKITI